MAYNVQQQDIDILFQREKELYVKILLLNNNLLTVDELQGVSIDGSLSISADSDVRISYSTNILLNSRSLYTAMGNKIWFNKYIRVFLGVKSTRTQKVICYPLGLFTLNENSFTYDEVTNMLSLSCVDLMAELNGTRSGTVIGLSTLIPAGEDIRSALVAAVSQLGGVKKYLIQDVGKPVPYDLESGAGTTVYQIISALRDLYPAWETFFDEDGTFICRQIPTCANENIVLDAAQMKLLVKKETTSNNFSEMKNRTAVWGAGLSCDRIAESCTNTGSQYNIVLSNFAFKERLRIAFKPNVNSLVNPTLKIGDLAACGIFYEDDRPVEAGRLIVNRSYVVRYKSSKFYLMGEFQIYAVASDNNPDSPFYIGDSDENLVLQVLSGGEYDNIYSDVLAQQRADYENWKSTRLVDKVTVDMIFVPWLTVNQKLEYTSLISGITHQYIVKSISFDILSGLMSVQMIQFYPLYPEITK